MKVKTLDLKALGLAVKGVRLAVKYSKMAAAVAKAKLEGNKRNPMQTLADAIHDYGMNETRKDHAKQIYNDALKGRTLVSVKLGYAKDLSNALDGAVTKFERETAKAYYELKANTTHNVLEFFQTMIVKFEAEKIADAKEDKAIADVVADKVVA